MMLTSTLGVKAQDTHWHCDIYGFEYDMAVYFVLQHNGVDVLFGIEPDDPSDVVGSLLHRKDRLLRTGRR